MAEFLLQYGLFGLFLLSFLAATVFPVASETGLIALLLAGIDPVVCVLTATTGNTLGSVTTWAIGQWGGERFLARLLRLSPTERERARKLFARYGPLSLLLAWMPIIGDPLCLVAGLFGLPLIKFLPPVAVGKLARYTALAVLFA